MSVTSIATTQPVRQVQTVEFLLGWRPAPYGTDLRAGRDQCGDGPARQDDSNMMGNLVKAANIISRMLVQRID